MCLCKITAIYLYIINFYVTKQITVFFIETIHVQSNDNSMYSNVFNLMIVKLHIAFHLI